MSGLSASNTNSPTQNTGRFSSFFVALQLLARDWMAMWAVVVLVLVALSATLGHWLAPDIATGMNLRARNAPPFQFDLGPWYLLGADALGRPILARIIMAAQTTLLIAGAAVLFSMVVGSLLGLVAGYRGGLVGDLILRLTDIIMSFPSLLLALFVLYVFEPSILNVVIVLAITRVPVYLRTVRAEVMEVRTRMFVIAARVTGAGPVRLILRHILPMVAPTIVTLMTIDFAFVMLAEASLSFLGLGVQAPEFTWGVMVAEGRNYVSTAWWLSFWPGLAIALVTMSLNMLSNWLRIVLDPTQRWRLEKQEALND